jgi:hypothetical protein
MNTARGFLLSTACRTRRRSIAFDPVGLSTEAGMAMRSRFDSRCTFCSGAIKVDDLIERDWQDLWVHIVCAAQSDMEHDADVREEPARQEVEVERKKAAFEWSVEKPGTRDYEMQKILFRTTKVWPDAIGFFSWAKTRFDVPGTEMFVQTWPCVILRDGNEVNYSTFSRRRPYDSSSVASHLADISIENYNGFGNAHSTWWPEDIKDDLPADKNPD